MQQKRDPATGRLPAEDAALKRSLREHPCAPRRGGPKTTCAEATGNGDMRCMTCGSSLHQRIRHGAAILREEAHAT